MSSIFQIKRGDTEPRLVASLSDSVSGAADLTAKTVWLHGKRENGETFSGQCTVLDAAAGKIEYAWTSENTSVVGRLQVEFEVLGATDYRRTYPTGPQNFVIVNVAQDISDAT